MTTVRIMILSVLMALGSHRRALMRWFVPNSDESHEKALKLWTPGTGDWLFEHADFVSWAEGPQIALWLKGIRKCGQQLLLTLVYQTTAGSGKTILMCALSHS